MMNIWHNRGQVTYHGLWVPLVQHNCPCWGWESSSSPEVWSPQSDLLRNDWYPGGVVEKLQLLTLLILDSLRLLWMIGQRGQQYNHLSTNHNLAYMFSMLANKDPNRNPISTWLFQIISEQQKRVEPVLLKEHLKPKPTQVSLVSESL